MDLRFNNFVNINCDISTDSLCALDFHRYAYTFDVNTNQYSCLYYSFKEFDFNKADYQGLNISLSNVDCPFLHKDSSKFDDKLNKFYNILFEQIACYVPMHYYTTPDSPPWFNKELKDAIYLKLLYYKQWKFTGLDFFHKQFRKQRTLCKHLDRFLYLNYI